MPSFNKPAKQGKSRLGIVILIVIILCIRFFGKKITLDATVSIKPGQNASQIFNKLGTIEKLRVKIYLYTHRKSIDLSKLESGTYSLSGSYTKSKLIQTILAGPTNKYIKVTILEGRSIYDIDNDLSKKGYIQTGEYIAYTNDQNNLIPLYDNYDFLKMYKYLSSDSTKTIVPNPEGFLYPDTYYIDMNTPVIPQLIKQQLKTFNTKVRQPMSGDFIGLHNLLKLNGVNITEYSITPYIVVILASILEKEERNDKNRPTVAGIFYKRLQLGMKLDADITLCYGLKLPYSECTPQVIGKNVGDASNVYNTRQVFGFPPQPISNPTAESIYAVLHPKMTEYLYYLHGSDGVIHYGKTLDEHNQNKKNYLQ